MRRFRLNLKLFDEGAASAAEGASVTGVTPGSEASADTAQEDAAPRPSFEDLIKGDYKKDADAYIQKTVRDRLKGPNKTIAEQKKILSVVAGKYGLDSENLDLAALSEKVSADDAYYEERAMMNGLTVEQQRRQDQIEAENRMYRAEAEQAQREAAMHEQVTQWQAQADQVKQAFPDFDLATELQNETFRQILSTGVDMQSAYVAVHNAEILQGAMRYTAQEVRKATVNDIQARGTRPRENASSSQAAAKLKTDVSKLTKADREELSRRAMSGEIVTLT